MSIGRYYKEHNITNTEFTDSPTIKFDNISSKILIVLDSFENNIVWSYNGRDVDGEMQWSDEKISLSGMTVSKIWIKANVNTGTKLRIWARL